MNRLFKLALGGNIQKSDVEFSITSSEIDMSILTDDKKLHDSNTPWNGRYIKKPAGSNVIGSITWSKSFNGGRSRINVGVLEIRNEYRDTRVVKYLLDYFLENVIKPEQETYGKDNVFLSTQFANEDLGQFLKRNSERFGVQWVESQDFSSETNDDYYDDEEELQPTERLQSLIEALNNNGITYSQIYEDDVYVTNCSVKKFTQIAKDAGYTFNGVKGSISSNCDIKFYLDSVVGFGIADISDFVYDLNSKLVTLDGFEELKKLDLDFLEGRLETVFDENVSLECEGNRFYSVSNLITNMAMAKNKTASRLRRL